MEINTKNGGITNKRDSKLLTTREMSSLSLGPSGVPCSWALRIAPHDGHLTTLLVFRRGCKVLFQLSCWNRDCDWPRQKTRVIQ